MTKENKSLTIVEMNGVAVMDSREVAVWVEKEHKNLMADIRNYIGCLEGGLNFQPSDFFLESTYVSEQNKTLPCYLVTRKGCEMIANKLTGRKGILFTAAYIEKFHEYESKLQNVDPRANILLRIYSGGQDAVIASKELTEIETRPLKDKIEADAPLVTFANHVGDTTDLIDVSQMAKIAQDEHINLGRNKLFDWLRSKGYLRGNNEPYQRYIDAGLFEVREITKLTPYGSKVFCKTFITGKGQISLVEKLRTEFCTN